MTEPIYRKQYKTSYFVFEAKVYHGLSIELIKLPVLKDIDGYSNQECTVFRKGCDPEWMRGDDPKEWISLAADVSNIRTTNYIVMWYIGRESASSNNHPNIALDGFLDCELVIALDEIERDDQLAAELMAQHSIRKMLTTG